MLLSLSPLPTHRTRLAIDDPGVGGHLPGRESLRSVRNFLCPARLSPRVAGRGLELLLGAPLCPSSPGLCGGSTTQSITVATPSRLRLPIGCRSSTSSSRRPFYLPWILLGFDPILVLGFQLFAFHYQAWLHTETIGPLGWLDRWLNTPANHRMHHSRARQHRDVNMGAILMIWDRLFGTYAAPEEAIRHGIPGVVPPESALALYLDPWRRPSTS